MRLKKKRKKKVDCLHLSEPRPRFVWGSTFRSCVFPAAALTRATRGWHSRWPPRGARQPLVPLSCPGSLQGNGGEKQQGRVPPLLKCGRLDELQGWDRGYQKSENLCLLNSSLLSAMRKARLGLLNVVFLMLFAYSQIKIKTMCGQEKKKN